MENSASEYASSRLELLTSGASMEMECLNSAAMFAIVRVCHENT